jgi:hypothetical protein
VRKALFGIPLLKGYEYIRTFLPYLLKLTEQLLHIRDMTDALLLAQDKPGAANQTDPRHYQVVPLQDLDLIGDLRMHCRASISRSRE